MKKIIPALHPEEWLLFVALVLWAFLPVDVLYLILLTAIIINLFNNKKLKYQVN